MKHLCAGGCRTLRQAGKKRHPHAKEKHDAILQIAQWNLPSGAYKSGLGLLLAPIVADHLVQEGFPTKEAISEYTRANSKLSLEEYWQYHLVEGFTLPAAQKGIKPFSTWLEQPKENLVNRYQGPEETSVIVVGGKTNDFWQAGVWRYGGTYSIDDWR